ncbi:MAG TPA: CAP domain-containing protein [Terriglobales bacterium]|jgi:hypothetical protein
MVWALIASLSVIFGIGAPPLKIQFQANAIAGSQDAAYDAIAERQLLDLANQARAKAGLEPLEPNESLTQSARVHASLMAAKRQLSHQFAGEPSLSGRLAADSRLHLDRAGENVASASTVEEAHDSLMHSLPHRENLLNPDYNAAGFAVERSGDTLFITQDFARTLPLVSSDEAVLHVAEAVNRSRTDNGFPLLQQLQNSEDQQTACAMGRANGIKASGPQARYVLRYTSMDPGSLPSGTERAVRDGSLHAFSVGACYMRSNAYPNGAYWVIVRFF